jgi:hypothetical protein
VSNIIIIVCCRNCKKIGPQVWLLMVMVITELLVALKFDWDTFTKPPPTNVFVFWCVALTILGLWTLWHFYLQRLLIHTEAKLSRSSSEAALAAAAASTTSNGKNNHSTSASGDAARMRLRSTSPRDNNNKL